MSAKAIRRGSRGKGPSRAAAPRFNRSRYARLLAGALPATITNEDELSRITAVVDRLAVKQDLSLEESRLLNLLATLIEVYEDTHHSIPDAPPHVMIQGFMRQRGLRNTDLEPVLGSSGVTSEVIRGKRKPSKTQIRNLAKFFRVSPGLFVPPIT